MKRLWCVLPAMLVASFCHGAGGNQFILTDAHEDDELFFQICKEGEELCKELSETLGSIEKGDFDPDGVALFDIEVDECDEVLLPWAYDQFSSGEIRSSVEKEARREVPQAEERWGAVLEENPYRPSFEGEVAFFQKEKVADSITKVTPREEKCPCNPRPRPKVSLSHPVEEEAFFEEVEMEERAPEPRARQTQTKKNSKTRVIRRLR